MDTNWIISVVGTMASVLGLTVAGIQTIRLRELRRRANADLWLSVRIVRSIISRLEKSPLRENDPLIAATYAKATELFTHLLQQAVLDESHYNENTIEMWCAAGRINPDWQAVQARQFLQTARVDLRGQNPDHRKQ